MRFDFLAPLTLVYAMQAGSAAADVELRFSSGTSHTQQAALTAGAEAFFGTTGRIGNLRQQDQASPALNLLQGRQVSLRFSRPLKVLSPHSRVRAGLALSAAHQIFRFEDGIDIFIDPAQLRLRSASLWADVMLERDFSFRLGTGRVSGDWTAGLGMVSSWYDLRLTSALLDVNAQGTVRTGYLRMGVTLDMPLASQPSPVPRLSLSVTVFDNYSLDLTTGLVLVF